MPILFNSKTNKAPTAPITKPLEGCLPIVSFFAGCGLLDFGFETAGFNPVFVNELNPAFLAAYHHARTAMGISEPIYGFNSDSIDVHLGRKSKELADIIRASKKRGLVGFVGGPPCPDFSVGGKNRGRHGDNGKLTKTYFDLICKHQPDWFLFENVKGLWSTRRHREFYEENIRSVRRCGYAVTDCLINAIEFGVPQDRERVIALGFNRSLCKKLNLEIGKHIEDSSFPWDAQRIFNKQDVFSLPWPDTHEFGRHPKMPVGVPVELTVAHWFEHNDVFNHPNSGHCFTPRAGLARFLEIPEGDDSRKSFKRLHRWRYSPTACYGNNEVHLHPWLPRRISVAEALAIQSLPKDFELPQDMTLSAMFKTIGNGVPFLAARGLATTIRDFLEGRL